MARVAHQRQHLIQALYDNPVGRAVTIGALTMAAAASILTATLPRSRPIEVNIPSIGRSIDSGSQSAGNSDQTMTDVYYSQIRTSLLQDIPEFVNYQDTLDYTARRIADERVNGVEWNQYRNTLEKWARTNITW